MSLREKIFVGLFVSACLVIVGGVIYLAANNSAHQDAVVKLQNELAARDETIEIQKGLYTKLTLQSEDLGKLLGNSNKEVQSLQDELKKTKSELLTANKLVLVWKSAYEAVVKGTQTEQPGEGTAIRKRVSFEKDFGFYGVSGFTLTDPPEATLKLQQNKPLQVAVTVSQDKDGTWHSMATSNDPNTQIDIALAGVNPFLFKPKWYENIGVTSDLALTMGKFGVLGSVGISYRIGQVDVGPKFWLGVSDNVNYGAGLGLIWHPFSQNK